MVIQISDGGFQISKTVRELCIFARQDITRDPPFSHLDLISCRNLLIYLEPVLQKRIIPMFHYALNPQGVLMLGSSETVGGFSDLFALSDKKALNEWINMLKGTVAIESEAIQKGKTLEQIKAEKTLVAWSNWDQGFMTLEKWLAVATIVWPCGSLRTSSMSMTRTIPSAFRRSSSGRISPLKWLP